MMKTALPTAFDAAIMAKETNSLVINILKIRFVMFIFNDMPNSGITDSKRESFIIELAFVIHRQKRRSCQDRTVSAKRCAHDLVDYTSYRGVRDRLVGGLIQIRGDAIVGIR